MIVRMPNQAARRIAWTACSALVFLSAFFLSGTRHAPLELDPSWHAALEFATAHHLQFGTQIVFTFGPLGFLAAPTSLGHLLGTRIAFAFFWSALVALTAITMARRLPLWVRCAVILWLAVFTLSEGLDQTAFWIMASGTLILLRDDSKQRWQAPIHVFAFIVLALIKASFFTAGIASLGLVMICWVSQRKFTRAMVLAIAAPAAFIVCWMALGQSPAHLAPWIRHGLELESGYSGAMNLVPKTPVLCSALAGLALFTAALIALFARARRDLITWAIAITLAQYGFMAWKEGFTRSGDWHAFVFLWYLPLGMAFFLLKDLPAAPTASHRWILNAAFAASMLVCIVAAHFQIRGFAWQQVATWPKRVAHNAQSIAAIVGGHAESLYADCHDPGNTGRLLLDHARDVIGSESVDVMNYLPLAAVSNQLNYQPRPVIQGFVAYNPALQRLNEEYFESIGRPHFVMLCQQATDGRFPGLEDSAALNYVLNNYVPVARDGRFLILRQQTSEDPKLQLVHEQTLRFGEKLDLSPWAHAPVFISAEIKPSLVGRAVTILYQQPPLFMDVEGVGVDKQYRIVPSMAERPFLLSPVLDANFDVLNFYTSLPGKDLESVTFAPPAHGSFEFRDAIAMRVYTAPAFPHAAKMVPVSRMVADVQGRVFWPLPTSVESAGPARLIIFHGSSALLVRAPSKIVMEIPYGALSFSGFFTVPEGANPAASVTPGVVVSIEVHDQSGKTTWKMDPILSPSTQAGDRGRFSFHVPIDSARDRSITLTTWPDPSGNGNGSLSIWSQCRFEEIQGK